MKLGNRGYEVRGRRSSTGKERRGAVELQPKTMVNSL